MTDLPKLPLLAGKLLTRLGMSNALEMDWNGLVEKIAVEQERRTRERKAAQIARANKKSASSVAMVHQKVEVTAEVGTESTTGEGAIESASK